MNMVYDFSCKWAVFWGKNTLINVIFNLKIKRAWIYSKRILNTFLL